MSLRDQNKTDLTQTGHDALEFIQSRAPLTGAGVAVAADYAKPRAINRQEIINKNIEMAKKASFDPNDPLYDQ